MSVSSKLKDFLELCADDPYFNQRRDDAVKLLRECAQLIKMGEHAPDVERIEPFDKWQPSYKVL